MASGKKVLNSDGHEVGAMVLLGSETLSKMLAMDEQQAWITLREAEAETSDYTIFDNYDTYRALDRSIKSATYTNDTISVQYFPGA